MEIKIHLEDNENENNIIKIDNVKFQKMVLLYNAINDGWNVKKRKDSFIFTKNHEGKKEVILDSYLTRFMKGNCDINKILS
jgi:hypothetical protein